MFARSRRFAGAVFSSSLLVIAGMTLSASAAAELRYYDIELIAFVHDGYPAEEHWPDAPEEPAYEETIGSLTGGASRIGIKILPRPDWRLGPVAYTLRKRGLRTVFHLAWRQAVPSRGSDSWLRVETSELRGRIRVTRGRYLHVDTDLLLDDRGSARAYRVVGSRRMRSTELHHLDHPKLGILVQADPYEPPAPAPVAETPPPADTAATESAASEPAANEPSADEQPDKR